MKMLEELCVLLFGIATVITSQTAGTSQLFNVCEGETKSLRCTQGTLISIEPGARYGLLAPNEHACIDITTGNTSPGECLANANRTLQILKQRCHAQQSCDLTANDGLFELGKGTSRCPGQDTIMSQLIFRYQCKALDLWPTTTHSTTTVVTTSTTVTTTTEPITSTIPSTIPLTAASSAVTIPTTATAVTEPSSTTSTTETVVTTGRLELAPGRLTSAVTVTTTKSDEIHATSTTEADISPVANNATVTPNPESLETCLNNATRKKDCYNWVCSEGRWERRELDKSDPACCSLWEGCSFFTSQPATQSTLMMTRTRPPTAADPAFPTVPTQRPETLLYCPEDTTYVPFELNWPEVSAGIMSTLACPDDHRSPPSHIRRQCLPDGKWSSSVDARHCPSSQIQPILNKQLENENLQEVTLELAKVTEEGSLEAADISAVARFIEDVKNTVKSRPASVTNELVNITKNVLEAGGNLLSEKNDKAWKEVEENEKSTKVMEVVEALESLARGTAENVDEDTTVESVSIVMKVKVLKKAVVNENTSVAIESDAGVISFPTQNLASDTEVGKLVAVFYQNTGIWSKQNTEVLNTRVFSASLVDSMEDSPRRELKQPFVYKLNHKQTANPQLHTCVFWDSTITPGKWSTEGCRRIEGTTEYSVCECDHMTNFAVLLDVTGVSDAIAEEHELSLRIITYAGCAISIICLLLSWLTFQFLKNLSSDRNTIHKHLVFNLMLAETLFLVAISPDVVALNTFCSVVAGLLHFLFLCVFAWTCLEGVQLYIMLIEVFEAERSRTLYYYLAGYGIPAIVVIVSAAVGHEGYGTDTVCWLSTNKGFIFSFVGPVAAVMAVNLIMLGIALYMMYNHARMVANMKHKETTRAESIKAWVKGAIVLVILLGLTWVFGFMYVNKDTLVFAYLFTILNSLQGLFIFIFHCFGNEKDPSGTGSQVQKEYKKLVRRTQWLPKCIRVHYGEHKGLSYATSSSSSSNNYWSKYFARRKSSDINGSSLSKTRKAVSPKNSSDSNGNNSFDDSSLSKEQLTSLYKVSVTSTTSNDSTAPLTRESNEHSLC